MEATVANLSIVLLVLILSDFGTAEECKKIESCKCKTDSGIVIDLNVLTSGPNPRFKAVDTKTQTDYYFSPCVPLKQQGCNAQFTAANLAMCQGVAGDVYYDAGDVGTEVFAGDPAANTLTVTYSAPAAVPITRQSKINLYCSGESRLDFVSEDPPSSGKYNFNLYSSVTCPRTESSGLSVGSVLVIIFFVFFLVYWIGGFIFMKFVRRAEGLEAIPNYEFWKELPLLIRDGVAFTARGCKGESTYEKI